ncbi:MAG: hydantoinase/oxoprolinase family protein [Candidatus Acidiferrales bacterium]
MIRIAIDAGGTFTDCVFLRGRALQILKIPSTPADPAAAIRTAIDRAGGQQESGAPLAAELICGTTVGTNALLQRRGGKVVLVTSAGFEDVLEIGRQARPQLYDFFASPQPPLVPRERRLGLRERVGANGNVILRPTSAELDRIVRRVRACRGDSVAICLLFSFVNSAHERMLARRLRAGGHAVSVSHEILPEIREFERTATTAANAYLAPVMAGYLRNLQSFASDLPGQRAKSQGRGPRLHSVRVMQSNGGVCSAAVAARGPVRTILSGPAGGVLGARYVAELAGLPRIISFDMGGTSTDVALIETAGGTTASSGVRTTAESVVAGLPVAVPMLDIHTVGAGGGSMARFDRAGALRVGPESAGADPGPIAYGRGEKPTVTDAHLILGHLGADALLGGEFPLNEGRTRLWMECARGRMPSVESFAQGILDVADTAMEKSIRVISVERGYDPRDYALVAFGGAGGLHACGLAAALRMRSVLVPKFPGGLSALGILRADVVKDFSRTVLMKVPLDGEGQSPRRRERNQGLDRDLQHAFSVLARLAAHEMRGEGFSAGQVRLERLLDVRYVGQSFDLMVPAAIDFVHRFHQEHARRYGYADRARPVEVVNVRIRATGIVPKPALPRARERTADARKAISSVRPIHFSGVVRRTPVYDRGLLRAGNRFTGPAVVTEYSGTTLVPPGWRARVDAYENLLLTHARPSK